MDQQHETTAGEHHRFPVFKIFLGAIALAFIITGAAVVLDNGSQPEQVMQVQDLPGGTKIGLKMVLGGLKYEIDTRTRLQRFREKLPKFLPEKLRDPGPHYFSRIENKTPGVTVVFETLESPRTGSSHSWDYSTVLSDDGDVWNAENNGVSYEYSKGSGYSSSRVSMRPLNHMTFTAVPWNAKELTVSLFPYNVNRDDAKPAATFKFANPLYNPSLKPLRAFAGSLHARDGLLSVTLLRMVTGVDQDWMHKELRGKATASRAMELTPKRASRRGSTWIAFQSQEGHNTNTDWKVESIRCSDAGGSEFSNNVSWHTPQADFSTYNFQPCLWADAGAFKLNMEFIRSKNFPEDELWTLDVDVPTTTGMVPDSRSKTIGGMRIELLNVGGPDSETSRTGCGTRKHLLLELGYDEAKSKRRFEFVRAIDNLGRTLQMVCDGSHSDGRVFTRYMAFESRTKEQNPSMLPSKPYPTSVTLTLASTPSHYLDFVAEPESAE